ncbi:hypothetical protein NM208_g16407 [Fusarium decemcellulare]|uniref:Uncharacterized protein n=1 Tax=Fusarium decemcellulare TaxID=57161 RepID=A0ACC1RAT6_9HYPO|nr:hypothetical protein NM208_g16407 [Fusarium decemcellulare]
MPPAATGHWCKAPFADITVQEPSHVDNARMDKAGCHTSNDYPQRRIIRCLLLPHLDRGLRTQLSLDPGLPGASSPCRSQGASGFCPLDRPGRRVNEALEFVENPNKQLSNASSSVYQGVESPASGSQ